jgi:acrylyl-CoA reductase (NADPH)
MNTAGGFGQFIRMPSGWITPLPDDLSLRESMIYGSAGFTAGLSVDILQRQGVIPEKGTIVVAGASGGVGIVSVALLASKGYLVSASTGKPDAEDFLKKLRALDVIGRDAVNDKYEKPLLKETWAGTIDTVGGVRGVTLANLLKSCKKGGAVAATGMVSSTDLSTTVFPFILRGVSLLGIDFHGISMSIHQKIWSKLAKEWKPAGLESLAFECRLEKLSPEIECILAGGQRGRVVVNLQSLFKPFI